MRCARPLLAVVLSLAAFSSSARERSVRQIYPPVAVSDFFSVTRGGTLTVPTPGVLDNDSRRAPGAARAIVMTNPAHGTLTLNFDGSFIYHHDGSAGSSDGFTYR